MTEHELRVCYETVYRMIANERRSRAQAATGALPEVVSVTECDNALLALTVMKDALKRHVTPSPIQEMLIDVPETARKVGGY